MGYVRVAGFVFNWKQRRDAEGRWISRVAPVDDPQHRARIIELIREKEGNLQVTFHPW